MEEGLHEWGKLGVGFVSKGAKLGVGFISKGANSMLRSPAQQRLGSITRNGGKRHGCG